MYPFVLFIHLLLSCLLVGLILLQQGKGAIVGANFGTGASQTVFGSRGSDTFLFRITMGLMLLFFITSLSLNRLLGQRISPRQLAAPITGMMSNQPETNNPLPSVLTEQTKPLSNKGRVETSNPISKENKPFSHDKHSLK